MLNSFFYVTSVSDKKFNRKGRKEREELGEKIAEVSKLCGKQSLFSTVVSKKLCVLCVLCGEKL